MTHLINILPKQLIEKITKQELLNLANMYWTFHNVKVNLSLLSGQKLIHQVLQHGGVSLLSADNHLHTIRHAPHPATFLFVVLLLLAHYCMLSVKIDFIVADLLLLKHAASKTCRMTVLVLFLPLIG